MNTKPLMDDRLTTPIKEAGYLFTQKSHRYRPIIRYMYNRHLAYSPFVFPSEILSYLKEFSDFEDYNEDELLVDLATLVERNNLEQIQDQSNVRTIEEYKKKRYRYKCTAATIELEKSLIGMETTLQSIRGSLEKSLPYNLYEQMQKLHKMSVTKTLDRKDIEEINVLWDSVFERFVKLTEDASDYLSHINGDTLEILMKGESFIAFKNAFTDYLQNFVGSLRQNTERIRKILLDMSDEKLTSIITALIRYQKTIPRLDEMPTDEVFYANYMDKWLSLKSWFISTPERDCYVNDLIKQTTEMIRKITKLAKQSAERAKNVRSRRTDFLHLAKIAQYMDSLEKVNEVHSFLFGFENTRHLKVKNTKDTDSNSVSVWDVEPSFEELKVRKVPVRVQKKSTVVAEKTEEKQKLMEAYQKQQKQQQKLIEDLVAKERIVFSELNVITPYERHLLLGWIGKAISNHRSRIKSNVYVGKTENGKRYELFLRSQSSIVVKCQDGHLRMPDYELVFTEGE